MNIREIIEQLRAEHELLTIAIARLEEMLAQRLPMRQAPRRRGRPLGSKNKPRIAESSEKQNL
jgi:hypothetical protein